VLFTLGAAGLVALLAPELLLLREGQVFAAQSSLLVAILLGGGLGTARCWWALRPYDSLIRTLALGSRAVEPYEILKLTSEVWRAAAGWALPSVGTLALLVAAWRPPIIDLITGLSLTLLGVVMVTATALPFYVVVRSAFAHTLELVDPRIMREVLESAEFHQIPRRRLSRQLLAAVAAPVAFVAIGAALVANAHLRRADERQRDETARALARAAFEPGQGVTASAGISEARRQAKRLGFTVTVSAEPREYHLKREADGISELVAPLDEGSAMVRFSGSTVTVLSGESLLIALLAVALASALGSRLARALRHDLRRATRGVRELAAGDVNTAKRYVRASRFRMVEELGLAIERLALRFRVFARAQRRAIEAREAAARMRGLFFASVSHDLKSPLNAILGFTEVIRQTEPLSPGQLESLELIERSGRELLALIETILDAARIEAGQLDLIRDEVTVKELFDEAIEKGRALGGHASVAVFAEIPRRVPRLSIDRVRIMRAIGTFVGHAMRTAEAPPVRLLATSDGSDAVYIEVSVPSQRFSAAQLEQLLDPSGKPGTAEHRGLALGLSLARSVITFHQGRVHVEDRGAKGVAFCVRLPTGAEFTNPRQTFPSEYEA